MIELIVDNEPLDLPADEKLIMSFQVADISDIDRRQGDFSYEFELPTTQKNKRLLKRAHTIFGYPYQHINAWLRSSADVRKGFIQVMEYSGKFVANFFSGNANWIALIGDKLLSDLNLSVFDHVYNRANVIDSFNHIEGYIYPYMRVHSGPDREIYGSLLGADQYTADDYIYFNEFSGEYFNQGLYNEPYYTASDRYAVSVYADIIISAYHPNTTSVTIKLLHEYDAGSAILDQFTLTGTGSGILQASVLLNKGEKIAVYVDVDVTFGGQVTVSADSSIRITTSFSDLENISYTDLFPAIYVHSLIKQIFQEIDFKLAGPFLNNADYKRLIMPFVGTSFARSGTFVITRSCYVGLSAPLTITDDTVDFDLITTPFFPGDNYAMPQYVSDGAYSVVIEALITMDSQTAASTDCSIRINGTPVDTEVISGNPYVELYAEAVLALNDIIEIYLDSTGGDITIGTDSWFKVTAAPGVGQDEDVGATLIVPEMKQIDLINYIFVSFGVVPVVEDFSKTLTLTEFRAIKQKPPEDWSTKLAGNYDIDFYQFANKYARRNYFKYADYDDDENLKNYSSRNDKAYGDGLIELDNVFLTGDTDVFQNEFVPVWSDNFTINAKTAYLAEFIRDKNPRILFVIPNAVVADFSDFTEIMIDGEVYPVTEIAWAYFTKPILESDLDIYKTNLSYQLPEILNGNGNGILSKYWEDYAGIINRPKKLIAPFKFSTVDLLNLDYTKRKYVQGENITGNYFLNRIINYDFEGKIAQCELMLIDNLDIRDQVVLVNEIVGDGLLLEDGFNYLYEDSDLILTEG